MSALFIAFSLIPSDGELLRPGERNDVTFGYQNNKCSACML
jgi:hypothetical protein